MCFNLKANLESQLKRARIFGDIETIANILKKYAPFTDLPLHHVSGFSHPKMFIYTDEDPHVPKISTWGLVPFWVKDKAQQKKIWNQTLNARGETIFEKPSFRDSAKKKRCVVYVDGFYEHHHFQKKTFPFFIENTSKEPIAFAGLWSEWVDKETGEILNTFAIVTTVGNSMMAKIHNNPKNKGPRMPLILDDEGVEKWLKPVQEELDIKLLKEIIMPFPEEQLNAYTVGRLSGKDYIGNVEEISDAVNYPELVFE